ncbi:MAG: HYR domain-containing protein [Acidobacteria bacterium]|nr:HYR domain-containing protein [Acidobacteriota bacterium]
MAQINFLPNSINQKSPNTSHFIIWVVLLLFVLLVFFAKTASGAIIQQQQCLTCPENIIATVDPNMCGANVTFPPPNINGCPTSATLTFSHPSGTFFPVGKTTVTVTASLSGQTVGQCSFTITVIDNEPPKITCPTDIIVNNSPGQASALVNFPSPRAMDNCGINRVVFDPPTGSLFPIGTTTVSLTAFDTSGNRAACFFRVIVLDQEPPRITCPANFTVSTSAGTCSAKVVYPAIEASDNSQFTSVTYLPPSGSFLPLGTTVVQVTATDRSGNTATCSFSVTVGSGEPLKINCPADILLTATNGQCGMVVNYPTPTVNNACEGVNITSFPASGTFFPLGTTLVIVTATDLTGAKATCTFNIKVNSSQPPQLACPEDIKVNTFGEDCAIRVDYPSAIVTNGCLDTKIEYSIPSGSLFAVGKTPVTVTATDLAGNKSTCAFIVEVVGVPILRLRVENNNLPLIFGPTSARSKPKKLSLFRMFELENIGCGPASMLFASMLRLGDDVDNQRIVNTDDRNLFIIQAGSPDRSGQRIDMGSNIVLEAKEKRTFFVLFQPLIPPVSDNIENLSAREVLPQALISRFTITQEATPPIEIPLVGKVLTEVKLIDPLDPRRAPKVSFSRNGDIFTVEFSVYDSNLDVNRATFQFFNSNGQAIDQAITVNLTQALQESRLLRGQSFTVEQQFTGASDHLEYNKVQVTVFDSSTSATAQSNGLTNITLANPLVNSSENKIVLPVINLVIPNY